MIQEFLNTYGLTIAYALLTAVAGIVGTWIGKVYKKYIDDKTKASVVSTCCKAVEQLYRGLGGPDKYREAVRNISEMLALKGITITELEVKLLIEATCSEFAHSVREEVGAASSSADTAAELTTASVGRFAEEIASEDGLTVMEGAV